MSDTVKKLRVRAPASTANLGPGFDCAAAALDLWNELVVESNGSGASIEIQGEGADELPLDGSHVALRAFGLLARADGYRFRFVNRIPLERGRGAVEAGAEVRGRRRRPHAQFLNGVRHR